LLLGGTSVDLDLSLEAEVEPLARRLAESVAGRAVIHQRFGTASVSGRGFRLDLARTRREAYLHPGALPQVETATLTEDLARRDFTINAIALRLTPEPAQIIDPYRGVQDVRSSLVRVLHDGSFQDDATRMLRAVRYASRLGFKIAAQTEALVRRDLTYLGTISGPRLRRELVLQFMEPAAVEGVLLGQRLGVLEAIHPTLGIKADVAGRWREALGRRRHGPRDELGFCLVANPRDEGAVGSISKWLHLAGRFESALHDLVRLKQRSRQLAMAERPSEVVEMLDDFESAPIWALAILDEGPAGRHCLEYLANWRFEVPDLDGDDLIAMGMAQGPAVGEMLRRLLNGRLDGTITTTQQEIDLVRKSLS
jgi:tRNA nucleotidyltransferase (CCA-adding enzyme)